MKHAKLSQICVFLLGVLCASAKSFTETTPRVSEAPIYAGVPVSADQKIIALGDLHGDFKAFRDVLQMAHLTDKNNEWIGGNTILVQTGDVADRGPQEPEIWALLEKLKQSAASSGGQVISLLGNHEIMNLHGYFRDVNPGLLRRQAGKEGRAHLFSKHGVIGMQLRQMKAVEKVGDTVFVHGAVNNYFARYYSIPVINGLVRRFLDQDYPEDFQGEDVFHEEFGPFWERGYSLLEERHICLELQDSLKKLGAKRMVVGHTATQGGLIQSRCGGTYFMIDVGMSRWVYNPPVNRGYLAALEIRNGRVMAIYPDGRRAPTPLASQSHPVVSDVDADKDASKIDDAKEEVSKNDDGKEEVPKINDAKEEVAPRETIQPAEKQATAEVKPQGNAKFDDGFFALGDWMKQNKPEPPIAKK